jgi:hypothetical protein
MGAVLFDADFRSDGDLKPIQKVIPMHNVNLPNILFFQ